MNAGFQRSDVSKYKVTLGVCVRNCEKYIGEAIESIIYQDFPHNQIKVVFVDDGSEDSTLSIIHDYVDKIGMTVAIFQTSWRGLGNARNLVIKNAEGDYLLWVDGDMILSRDFVRKLVEYMEYNPKIGVVKGKQALLPGCNLLATLETYSRAAGRMVNYKSIKAQFKSLGTGGALYRLNAIKQVGFFDKNLKGYNEDFDFELRLRKAGWLLDTFDVFFCDYERRGLTWRALWNRYWLRGYNSYYFTKKHRGIIKHYKMFPPAAAIFGLFSSFNLFRLTGRRIVFLLPIQFILKMTAWYVGFVNSHFENYAKNSVEKL